MCKYYKKKPVSLEFPSLKYLKFLYIPGAILEEWSQCIKSMGVSSRESWAYRLTDGTSRYECFFYKIMIFETKINLCNFL